MPEFSLVEASAVSLAVHLVFGVVAIFVGAITVMAVDRFLLTKINLQDEIAKGNVAAAIFAGAMWIALALIMTRSG
ncbi:MAG TPA: DUF350 domain-containing protein [Myxococcota bacterium]|jgi:uncharacterized membrane protein YjfL (UPF0719 family)